LCGGGQDWRFKELASRQAGRFEVRHGPRLTAALAATAAASAPLEAAPPVTRGAAAPAAAHSPGTRADWPLEAAADLQAHPGVLAVLRHACASPGLAPLDRTLRGDRLVARDVGAFVSRPGAQDQP
jgi:hypothetical protein